MTRKLSPRTANLLFAPTVGLVMSGAMSFALTAINLGFDADFAANWLRSFAVSFAVAVPISALVVPHIQKMFAGMTENYANQGGNIE